MRFLRFFFNFQMGLKNISDDEDLACKLEYRQPDI